MGDPVIRVLEPGDEVLLEAFLLPQVESSMFLLGNLRAAGLLDSGQAYEGTYAALVEGGEIRGVVAHYWNGNLLFQAMGYEDPLWRAAVEASGRQIGGLIGPDDQVSIAKEALRIVDSVIQMDETEKLYSLNLDDLIVPGDLSSGGVAGRRMESGDVNLVTEWRVAFSVEATGAKETSELRERSRVTVGRSQREGRTWLVEREGRPLACSSFNAAIKEAVQIGGVWTPPELRGRGYGRCAVAASLMDARAEGVRKAVLFTGEGNIAAQRAYAALGFRHIGDYRMVLLQPQIEAV